jgi:predicted O-methyltransferase YrrM
MQAGYITDVAYTTNYYNQLSPHWLNLICATNGMPALPLDRPYAYCEIGCGTGFTTTVLAAGNPNGHFYGVDMNADHIRTAHELATAGQVGNVTFLERDASALLDEALPDFEFITLHGVYAWVSQEVRAAIVRFIEKKLKPGGVVLVSYNALPGWSAMKPLRAIMQTVTEPMQDKNALYFTGNPAAKAMLATLEKADLRYVAHEYLNEHWNPMYFAQVAREMGAAGLMYTGGFPLHENFHDLSLPGAFHEMFESAPSRYTFETHKDFVRNTQFRSDVYVKPTVEPRKLSELECFREIRFGLVAGSAAEVVFEAQFPFAKMQVEGEIYPALLACLERRSAATVGELAKEPSLAACTQEDILSALQKLMLLGACHPFATAGLPITPIERGVRLLHPLSEAILERRLFEPGVDSVVLPSPVTGGGFRLDKMEALVLHGCCRAGFAGAVDWAVQTIKQHGATFQVMDAGGIQQSSEAAARQPMAQLGERMQGNWGRTLAALGVIGPA